MRKTNIITVKTRMVAVDKLVLAGNKLSFGRPWALLEHVASPCGRVASP